jgi:hypothetical protein
MTFSKEQQQHARKILIEECRQKAWSAACTADHIARQFDRLMAKYEKLKKEDAEHETEIEALNNAFDYHTKENREKRAAKRLPLRI